MDIQQVREAFEGCFNNMEMEQGVITTFVFRHFRAKDLDNPKCINCGNTVGSKGIVHIMPIDEAIPAKFQFQMQEFGPFCTQKPECQGAVFDKMLSA